MQEIGPRSEREELVDEDREGKGNRARISRHHLGPRPAWTRGNIAKNPVVRRTAVSFCQPNDFGRGYSQRPGASSRSPFVKFAERERSS